MAASQGLQAVQDLAAKRKKERRKEKEGKKGRKEETKKGKKLGLNSQVLELNGSHLYFTDSIYELETTQCL